MKAKYLSYAQAFAMCRDFQQLRGEPIDSERTIGLVAVVPYSRILQWQYILDLLKGDGNPKLTGPENPAGRYDVVLIAEAKELERGFVSCDLRSYLAAHRIPFPASKYACLRSTNISVSTLASLLS